MTFGGKLIGRMYDKMSNWLNRVDMYGAPIQLNFDGQESHIKTNCGGILTIIVFAITTAYSVI